MALFQFIASSRDIDIELITKNFSNSILSLKSFEKYFYVDFYATFSKH